MDRKTLGKIVAERFPNLMKVVDLENWGILEIPSKGIKSPGNGRKEGKEGGREGRREKGRKKQGGGGRDEERSKEGRKHLVPSYWELIFWRGDQQ